MLFPRTRQRLHPANRKRTGTTVVTPALQGGYASLANGTLSTCTRHPPEARSMTGPLAERTC